AACALEALAPPRPRERPAPAQLPARLHDILAASPDPASRPLEALLQEMLRLDPAARPAAAQARDRSPPPSAPTAQWSGAADGSLFVVADRLETAEAGPEVPLDGPGPSPGSPRDSTSASRRCPPRPVRRRPHHRPRCRP